MPKHKKKHKKEVNMLRQLIDSDSDDDVYIPAHPVDSKRAGNDDNDDEDIVGEPQNEIELADAEIERRLANLSDGLSQEHKPLELDPITCESWDFDKVQTLPNMYLFYGT